MTSSWFVYDIIQHIRKWIRRAFQHKDASDQYIINKCIMFRWRLEWNINILRPRQDGRYFADHLFKYVLLNENVWISNKLSLKFVPKDSIKNIPALDQIIGAVMAWRRPGDKPLSEPMMVWLPPHICIIRPQWVNVTTLVDAYISVCDMIMTANRMLFVLILCSFLQGWFMVKNNQHLPEETKWRLKNNQRWKHRANKIQYITKLCRLFILPLQYFTLNMLNCFTDYKRFIFWIWS